MSNPKIIYDNGDGGIGVISPAICGLSLQEIAEKDVPSGARFKVVAVAGVDLSSFSHADLTDGIGSGPAHSPPPPEPGPEPVEQPPTIEQLQAAIEAVAKAAGVTDQALDTVMESVGISHTIRTSPAIEGKT